MKEKRGVFSDVQLQQASKSVLEDGKSIRKSPKEYGVPKSTRVDYVQRAKKNSSKFISKLSMTTKQAAYFLTIQDYILCTNIFYLVVNH